METLFKDIRYGIKSLAKQPGFTLIAIVTLALGIGANTAVFSVINGLLLRPLPADRSEELFAVSRGTGQAPPASYPDYVYYRDQNQVFSGLAASAPAPLNFGGFDSGGGDQGGVIMGEIVSGNYFSTLGVNAELGRALTPQDDQIPGANPVAVISHRFWKNRLAGASDVVGKALTLNGHRFTVIGVMPESFTGTLFTPHVWVPLAMQAQLIPGAPDRLHDHRDRWLGLIGRLRPGIAPAQAAAALTTLDGQLRQQYVGPERRRDETSLSLLSTRGVMLPHLRRMITIISTLATLIVGSVLLIACANVASWLLARATARRREIAVRIALGASRWRLIRQLLTESLLLATLSAVAGLIVASWAMALLIKFIPAFGPLTFAPDLRLDGRVFLFTLAVSLLTGVIVGLAPALQTSKSDLVSALRDVSGNTGGRRRSRLFGLRGLLVSAEVAISLVLLITTGLFIRSSQIAKTIDPGFDTENGLVLTLDLGLQDYSETRGKQFQLELKERLAALPGVKAVSQTSYVPLGPGDPLAEVRIEGREPAADLDQDLVGSVAVDSNYFQIMGARLLQGRNFGGADRETSPKVVVINQTMAKRYWPGADAVGKRLRLGAAPDAPLREVVAVVQDGKWRNLGEEPRAVVYRPIVQTWSPLSNYIVRTAGQPNAVLADVRREVQRLDPNLPVQALRTLSEHVSEALWPARFAAALLTVFGLLALTMAAVGLSGVIAYMVSQRTREIGIRLALGAQTADVLNLVIWQGLKLTLAGVGFGLLGAFALTRLTENLLYGLSPTDPLTFLAVTSFLVAVALLACYIPARRVTKVDPLVALRYE
jgi:putative ABC transport system permease protein